MLIAGRRWSDHELQQGAANIAPRGLWILESSVAPFRRLLRSGQAFTIGLASDCCASSDHKCAEQDDQ